MWGSGSGNRRCAGAGVGVGATSQQDALGLDAALMLFEEGAVLRRGICGGLDMECAARSRQLFFVFAGD